MVGITDNLNNANSQSLGYDALNRLTGANSSGYYGSLSYGYDADGNRDTETLNGVNTTLTIAAGSNQLLRLSGGQTATYSYDADGSLTGDGTYTYAYDDSERLASVAKGSAASYVHNALGERVEKTVGSTTTVYVYDEAGHLIGEYTSTGGLIAEHIWLGNRPIGVITSSGLYYVQTDQLGTPRVITNSSKTIVWQWQSDPFGNSTPTGSLTYNLRYPGQYYDAETGLNYNYFRYYDPTIGRFISSDPIGLAGGINTYTYVVNNPLDLADPLGLCGCAVSGYPHSLDPLVNKDVAAYNKEYGYLTGNPAYLDPNLIKAMIMVESGHDLAAYNSDPLQVNNPGDWDAEKSNYGLTNGVAPGAALGIQAGIGWLGYKAFTYDSMGNDVSFRGWSSAVSRYNGGGDPDYLEKVMNFLKMLESPECQN